MGLIQSTAPTIEPVTVAELRDHAHIDTGADDTALAVYAAAAREYIENYTNRQLISASWTWTLDEIPELFRPRRSPLISVTSLKYYDTAGVQQTLSSATYAVDASTEPGRIALAYGQSWPSVRAQQDAVELIFLAGYGLTTATVPAQLRLAIMQLAAHWAENREPVAPGGLGTIPLHVERLIDQKRLPDFGP